MTAAALPVVVGRGGIFVGSNDVRGGGGKGWASRCMETIRCIMCKGEEGRCVVGWTCCGNPVVMNAGVSCASLAFSPSRVYAR